MRSLFHILTHEKQCGDGFGGVSDRVHSMLESPHRIHGQPDGVIMRCKIVPSLKSRIGAEIESALMAVAVE